MADEKADVSSDEVTAGGDEALRQLLDGHGSVRLLRVTGHSAALCWAMCCSLGVSSTSALTWFRESCHSRWH
jgi:hypothetical protein